MGEPSRRRRIADALQARLTAITQANGFVTDAGLELSLGFIPDLGPDDRPSALCLLFEDDTLTYSGEKKAIQLPIEVCAVASTALDNPLATLEDLRGDVLRAIELPDRSFGGLLAPDLRYETTRSYERRPGDTYIAIGVRFLARYNERWGAPEV